MEFRFGKILLVDDNPHDVELTLKALVEYRLENIVDVAIDGEEALDYLLRQGKFSDRFGGNPAVVLLDLKLPKLDGLEVLKKIKSDDRLKWIPIVVLTSSREDRDLIESYKLGVNAFVVKPVDSQGFMEAIKEIGLFWALLNETPPS